MANELRTSGVFSLGALGGDGASTTRPTRRWGGMTGRSLVESTAASGDANWSDVTLLLRGDNSTLEDISGSNHTSNLSWTGTATYATGKYGGAFDLSASSRYLNGPTTTQTSDFAFGTGDFTIETWVYLPSSGLYTGDKCLFETRGGGTGGWVWFFTGTGTGTGSGIVQRYFLGGSIVSATSNNLSTDTWHHVALVRSGSNITFYRDGLASGGASNVGSVDFSQGTGNGWRIGIRSDGNEPLTGLVDDFRITKGVARDIAADWTAGVYSSPLPQGAAVAASTNVPTTGVLSLPELLQASYGGSAAAWDGTGAELLLVAGGGGGGGVVTSSANIGGGGGGAGAYYPLSGQTFALNTSYTFTVGAGGAGNTGAGQGSNGGATTLVGGSFNLSSPGGGGGGAFGSAASNGASGGSGGGAGWNSTGGSSTAGAGQFGNAGGSTSGLSKAGGGGGAGSAGAISGSNYDGADGGSGKTWAIDGVALAGGGGAGGWQGQGSGYIGQGQDGGANGSGGTATANTGGGGGGGRRAATEAGTDGASGVIKVWVPQAGYSGYTAGTPANVTASAVTYSGTAGTLLTVTGTTTITFS